MAQKTMGGAGGTRPRSAEATRQALLSAAKRRFTLRGYDSTTTREVARDAGVNAALIKRYFGSKEGLLEALLAEAAATPLLAQLARRGDIAAALAAQVQEEHWPEYGGQHPLMLWIRTPGDPRTTALRTRVFQTLTEAILRAAGGHLGPEHRLRAQLLVTVVVGVAIFRAMVPLGPLATANADDLVSPLGDVVNALLAPLQDAEPG